ncbi:MAG: hypothetical protein ACI9SE_003983, partial [Neolewinella sp.]
KLEHAGSLAQAKTAGQKLEQPLVTVGATVAIVVSKRLPRERLAALETPESLLALLAASSWKRAPSNDAIGAGILVSRAVKVWAARWTKRHR